MADAAGARAGTGSVSRVALRVAGAGVLDWWEERLARLGMPCRRTEQDGRAGLAFEDGERQRLLLLDDGGTGDARPWDGSTVPPVHQIRGLGPVTLCLREMEPTEAFLTDVLGMRRVRAYADADGGGTVVLAMGDGGPGAELHLRAEPRLPTSRQGAGAVHHVAFRVADSEYDDWVDRLRRLGVRFSGPVDRFYFRSLYAREPGGILCEIATEGPGFGADEAPSALGTRLALPPFLEARRGEIEAGLKPLAEGGLA